MSERIAKVSACPVCGKRYEYHDEGVPYCPDCDNASWREFSFVSREAGVWEVHDEDGDDGTLITSGSVDEVLAVVRTLLLDDPPADASTGGEV